MSPAAHPDNRTRGSVEERTDLSGPPPPLLHKHLSVSSSRMDAVTKLTSSGMTVPLPASSHTAVSQGIHSVTVASGGDRLSKPPALSNSSLPVLPADLSVPKLQGGVESWSQPPELKESASKEKDEVGAGRVPVSSMPPLSHHSAQDNAPAENLHSKPPLLHPAPPLTIPTVVPSATPPPPPLTPVLPQDPIRKEMAPNSGQSTPPPSTGAEGQQADLTAAFSLRDPLTTASPLSLAPDLATVDRGDGTGVPADCDSVDGKVSAKAPSELKDTTSSHPSSSSDTDGQKPVTGEPTSADPSSDEGNPKTRRFTRKRKTTHSESDNSSSEPAPKLSCMESAQGSGSNKGAESGKTGNVSEHPPKLTREGKRSNIADKKEEEKGGKKEEEKGERKEEKKEEGKGGKREEEKAASKNMGPHHDRNILDATPEEIAKKMAAATTGGKRRVHYAYVPEKSLNQCKHGTFFRSLQC